MDGLRDVASLAWDVAGNLSQTRVYRRLVAILNRRLMNKTAIGTDIILVSTELTTFSSDTLEGLLSLGVSVADLKLRG